MSIFQFKQFAIDQTGCAMKIGTDGILLGSWADGSGAKLALDIGTGTGLLSLMLAQRYPKLTIDAVEIEEAASETARRNFANSSFAERINSHQGDYKSHGTEQPYDLIICNPPYFEPHQSSSAAKGKARQRIAFQFEEWLSYCAQQTTAEGTLQIVLPTEVWNRNKALFSANSWHANSIMHIQTKPGVESKRVLLSFRKKEENPEVETLLIEDQANQYTAEFKELTKAFYLNH